MDIQYLTSVSTVVINSLLMLLKDNHVDVDSVVMQLSNNKEEALSPEVNLGELTQQTLDELQKAKASAPEGFVLVEKQQLAQLMADMDYMGKKALGSDYVSFADVATVLDEVIEAQEPSND